MADRPDPYVRKDPNDIIRSGDWNELQIRAREEIRSHRHTGKNDGTLISGEGIDPAAEVSVRSLTCSGNLIVKGNLAIHGKALLGDLPDLLASIKGLQSDKVNHGGDPISGSLSIPNDLLVGGDVNVVGRVISKMSVATGLGPNDETSNGPIATRVLLFRKLHAQTAIRIIYCDTLRVYGDNTAARWEIRVDGSAPPGGAIYMHKASDCVDSGMVTNQHDPTTILGYAIGIPLGIHSIGVWVGPIHPHECRPHTGWNNSRWTLEAQEVWI